MIDSMEGKALFSANELHEAKREQWGAKALVDKLFKRFELDKAISSCLNNREL